jgi:ATP-dependent Lon protease
VHYAHLYREHFDLSSDISTRDRTGVEKTFSGLMKILFPHQEAELAEVEELLRFAMEGRKRVKDQLFRIDPTYAEVTFSYTDQVGRAIPVTTLEEEQYPRQYAGGSDMAQLPLDGNDTPAVAEVEVTSQRASLQSSHTTFQENQRGVTFDALFGPYLVGARRVVVTDPYIRAFYQIRNLMELLECVARYKADDEEVVLHLVTVKDEYKAIQQEEYFQQMQSAAAGVGIGFTWEFDTSGTIHARHIVTDSGWKILLDRGLDIFQHYEMNDAFAFANRLQQFRACKAFEVTYIKIA